MKFYMAPLEGITGYIYRNTLNKYYGEGIDKFFTPFVTPHAKNNFNSKIINDITPEHNQGMYTVVQILTNHADEFLDTAQAIHEMGYNEINLNLGCPSGTVASKKRGAGFLSETEKLDEFLYTIYDQKPDDLKISVKTRIGIVDPEEFYNLLDIYNKYPMEELIIHPRVLKEYYKGIPHRDIFLYAVKNSKNPLIYNGDIWNIDDYIKLKDDIASTGNASIVDGVMIGRGVLQNPALLDQLSKYEVAGTITRQTDWETLREFHDDLKARFVTVMSGDMNMLYKMKELWPYMINLFPDSDKEAKQIRKSTRQSEYDIAVNALFRKVAD